MRLPARKREMATVTDMRERRKCLGISREQMADVLQCADAKYVNDIEAGKCSITAWKLVAAAYALNLVTVEAEGIGAAYVIPARCKPHSISTTMRPGEAAWILREENQEAVAHLEEIQRAVNSRDREALVHIYEQVVCDPSHAAGLVAGAIDRIDPAIGTQAWTRHARKIAAKAAAETAAARGEVA